MKQIHRLLALGIISVLTVCCSNPYFNEDGLKSLLKEKTGIIIEDSLTIINFEWSAAIGRDYSEEYTLKCSPNDHERMLNHAIQNDWENIEKGYQLIIPQVTFQDTMFIFFLNKHVQKIHIQIIEE